MMWPWMLGGWGGMGTGMLFFWLLLFAGGYYFFRVYSLPVRRYRRTPQEILRERYARGEITKEEYEEMRKDLGYN